MDPLLDREVARASDAVRAIGADGRGERVVAGGVLGAIHEPGEVPAVAVHEGIDGWTGSEDLLDLCDEATRSVEDHPAIRTAEADEERVLAEADEERVLGRRHRDPGAHQRRKGAQPVDLRAQCREEGSPQPHEQVIVHVQTRQRFQENSTIRGGDHLEGEESGDGRWWDEDSGLWVHGAAPWVANGPGSMSTMSRDTSAPDFLRAGQPAGELRAARRVGRPLLRDHLHVGVWVRGGGRRAP